MPHLGGGEPPEYRSDRDANISPTAMELPGTAVYSCSRLGENTAAPVTPTVVGSFHPNFPGSAV